MSEADRRQDRTGGVIPAINDLMAIGILIVVYFIRIASVTEPNAPLTWWLILTTDFILPVLAGAWVFLAAMYVLATRSDDLL